MKLLQIILSEMEQILTLQRGTFMLKNRGET